MPDQPESRSGEGAAQRQGTSPAGRMRPSEAPRAGREAADDSSAQQVADAQARALHGMYRRKPAGRGRSDDTTLRGGLLGITAVTLATVAISMIGLLISVVVALLY